LKNENLEEIVKTDPNLTNNLSTLMSKLKIYDNIETFISKLNQARNKN